MDLAASSSWTAEFIFHGTGSSGSVPNIECLTAPKAEDPCRPCHTALTPEGKKNRRRNTGAIIRVRRQDGSFMTVVIDVGKNFRESAIEWFPTYGLRKIDAVLLTHPHADAVNGLDDLRAWTHGGTIQLHIDIYASKDTFSHVQKAFPYLISSELASGGGDVPKFKWHIVEPDKPFFIEDIEIHPFNVQHGLLFSPPNGVFNNPLTPLSSQSASPGSDSPPLIHDKPNRMLPYFSMGFVLLDIVYMSDVSHIPESTWDFIFSINRTTPYKAFIVDCLKIHPYTSHFGFAQAIAAARRLGAQRTYMVGFSHELLHEDWEKIGEYFEHTGTSIGTYCGGDKVTAAIMREAVEDIPREPSIWIRPAYDGLRFVWDSKGIV